MKSSRGFSVFELLLVIFVIGLVALSGFYVYKHHQNSQNVPVRTSFMFSQADLTDASAQTIVDFFSAAAAKNFQTVDSFTCNGMGGCGSMPADDIASMENNSNDIAPARMVSGYNFYEVPMTDSSDQLDLETQNSGSTQSVINFLNGQLDAEKFSATTSKLNSKAEPTSDGATIYKTFYNQQTICEIGKISDSGGAKDMLLSCAPLDAYVPAAQQLKPLFNAFAIAHQQFQNPEKSGLWLELSPNDTDVYNSYISDSKIAGYQSATATAAGVNPKKPNATFSFDGYDQFFWAKNNIWHWLPNVPTQLSDGTNLGTLPCAYSFPSSDARLAYIGQPCEERDQTDSMSTFQ